MQVGASDQTDGAVPRQAGDAHRGPARPEPAARRAHHTVRAAAGGHRRGAAHCLRQRREPAAGPLRRPRGRDGRQALDRRQPLAAGASAADRIAAPRVAGRARRARHRQVDARRRRDAAAASDDGNGRDVRPGHQCAALCRRPCARRGAAVRARAGAAQHATGPAVDAEGSIRTAERRARGRAIPDRARDRADRPRDGAARVGRTLRAQPDERQPRRSRPRHRSRRQLRDCAGHERLLARADTRCFSSRSRIGWPRCRASPSASASLVRVLSGQQQWRQRPD